MKMTSHSEINFTKFNSKQEDQEQNITTFFGWSKHFTLKYKQCFVYAHTKYRCINFYKSS